MKLIYTSRNYSVTTTVGELIKELQKYPENMLVRTEGCDCIGDVVSFSIERSLGEPDYLLLNRDDSSKKELYEKYKDRIVNIEDMSK